MRHASRYGNCMMIRSLLALLVVLSMLPGAIADEKWTTDDGEVIYEREIEANQMAVFKSGDITMYIEGLAGVYQDRGSYSGIWVLNDAPEGETGCPVAIIEPGTTNGTTTFWGQMEITFIDPDFPSIWIAQLGECFGGFSSMMIARPDVER